jgi:hypothetical protein
MAQSSSTRRTPKFSDGTSITSRRSSPTSSSKTCGSAWGSRPRARSRYPPLQVTLRAVDPDPPQSLPGGSRWSLVLAQQSREHKAQPRHPLCPRLQPRTHPVAQHRHLHLASLPTLHHRLFDPSRLEFAFRMQCAYNPSPVRRPRVPGERQVPPRWRTSNTCTKRFRPSLTRNRTSWKHLRVGPGAEQDETRTPTRGTR